jgi:hypothetical protein
VEKTDWDVQPARGAVVTIAADVDAQAVDDLETSLADLLAQGV